jgi:hypothetical protein
MIDVKVRYNTKCDDNHKFWRVLIDGSEYIASNVIFEIPDDEIAVSVQIVRQ